MLDVKVGPDGTVTLAGRLDAAESERALTALQSQAGPLTLDCSRLEYISSAGISVIMQTFKRLSSSGSKLVLTGLTPRVRSVFTYAGLDRVLEIQ